MSALTETIGHYHRVYSIESTDTEFPGIECRCTDAPERMWWSAYAEHVAEVAEAATRAAVAADIRALADEMRESVAGSYNRVYMEPGQVDALAARIAEGAEL